MWNTAHTEMGLGSTGKDETVGTYLLGKFAHRKNKQKVVYSTMLNSCQVRRGSQELVLEETQQQPSRLHYPGHADSHVICGTIRKQDLLFFFKFFGGRISYN